MKRKERKEKGKEKKGKGKGRKERKGKERKGHFQVLKHLNQTCLKGRRFGSCILSNIKINIFL
jgi:hypothetical protein